MGMTRNLGRRLGPHLPRIAPNLTGGFVREALDRALRGIGPLKPAADAAEQQRREQDGDTERAIHEVIENHVRMAGAQGFVTNLGGLVTMTYTIPANITGLALIQARMVAGIAHLRGYDLADPRTRNAVLATMLGEDEVSTLVRQRKIPGPPMALATSPGHDEEVDRAITSAVASTMLGQVASKRVVSTVARRVPVVGGLLGLGGDAYATWKAGRYADRELLPRTRR